MRRILMVLATLVLLVAAFEVGHAAYTRKGHGSDTMYIVEALEYIIDVNEAIQTASEAVQTAVEKMDDAAGSGLTYTRVKIDQGAAGRATLLEGAANKTQRLHALIGTMGATGTVQICYDDDGAGTNEVVLTGDIDVAALGGVVIPFCRDPEGCLSTDGAATKRWLTIVTTGGDFNGYAVVSTD